MTPTSPSRIRTQGVATTKTNLLLTQRSNLYQPRHLAGEMIGTSAISSDADFCIQRCSKNRQYVIFLSDEWFDMPTTIRVIENVESSPLYPRNNVKPMISQGTAMLHEMHHIKYKPGENEEGFRNHKALDVEVGGGRVYGPARAKWFAQASRARSDAA